MSSTTEGKELPLVVKNNLAQSPGHQASARKLDHHNNAGLATMIYGGPQTILVDSTTTPGSVYYGFAAPGSDTAVGKADDRWRIMLVTGDEVRWGYLPLDPAVPGTGPDFAGRPNMVWDDRAAILYA